MESSVRLTLRNLAPSEALLELIRAHLRYLQPYEDCYVRCHLELDRADEDSYQAHLQLILMRGDVIRVHASEDDPSHESPDEALTATFARAVAQLSRARGSMPPEARSDSAWTRV